MQALAKVLIYQPLFNIFILIVALLPNHNIGLAVILLTILVRLALTPIKHKTFESQLKQRELQPEMKRVQERYKNDRQAQSAAMMQLYRDKGVNPASGCLPMVVQIIILIGLFSVFRHGFGPEQLAVLYPFVQAPDAFNTHFLWVKDVTQPDHTFILPVLAGGAQYLYSRSMMSLQPLSNDPNDMAAMMSKQMMYIAPIATILFARNFAAALSLYWVIGALVDWAQHVHGMQRVKTRLEKNGRTTVTIRKRKEKS